jgi:outer membrane receptor for ferrienterochelin and colicin
MSQFFTRIKVTAMIIAALYGGNSFSQTDTTHLENLSLEQLLQVKVTTASRKAQELGLTPATVVLVTKEQIKVRGYHSLLEVLYDLPDVKVDDKSYSMYRNSLTIRGTQGSEKLVILLDGVAISSPSGEAMPIMENYPVNMAEQIEIVFGPASALYGANAVSGIVNIITKKSGGDDINVEVSSMAGTYASTNSTVWMSGRLKEDVQFIVSGQYFHDKGADYSNVYKNDSLLSVASYHSSTFNTIYGPMTPVKPVTPAFEAPMTAYNVYVAVQMPNFTLSYFRNYTKTPSAWGNNTSNALYNKEVNLGQTVSVANAAYKIALGKLTSATQLTFSDYLLDPNSNYRNLYTGMEPAYKYSTCSMIKGEELLTYKASSKIDITAGTGYEHYNAIPQSFDLMAPVNKNEQIHGSYLGTQNYYRPQGLDAQFFYLKFDNIGSFIQTQYAYDKHLQLTLGARFDVNSRYGSTFNPRAGIVYKPFKRTAFKLLYGSAFLAPSPSSMYMQWGGFDTQDSGKTYHANFLHLANPNLKPILSHNLEMNVHHYFSKNISATIDGYYTRLSGLNVYADDNMTAHIYNNMFNGIPADYVEVTVNQNNQKIYGGSLQLNWKHSIGNVDFNTMASVSYTDGRMQYGASQGKDIELDYISHYMIHVGTDLKAGNFTCAPRLILVSEQLLSGIADSSGAVIRRQTIPGYALLNFSARYNFRKGFSLFANVTNALNQDYKNVGPAMDQNITNTEVFNQGQPEDPVRVVAGFTFSL